MPTTSAPSAMALTTSVPRMKPPSTTIVARPADGLHHLGQHVDAAAAVIELAAAVVGDVDHVDAVLDGDARVLGGGDALEDQRDVGASLEALDVVPAERGLEVHAADVAAPGRWRALGDVALAPAVDRGVDGDAEGGVAGGDGALDVLVDEGVVAAHVELEDVEAAAVLARSSSIGRR